MESIVIELSKNKSLCVRIIYQRENMVSFNKGKRDIIKKKKTYFKVHYLDARNSYKTVLMT